MLAAAAPTRPRSARATVSTLKVEKVVPGASTLVIHVKPVLPGRYTFLGEYHEKTARGLAVVIGGLGPTGQRLDVARVDLDAVLVAQHVLEQHLDRVGESIDAEAAQALVVECVVGE